MTTTYYDLYRLDIKGNKRRLYENLDLVTAKAKLSLELSDPNEKGRWSVTQVKTTITTAELNLVSFCR
jgi:hypothetical protein